MTSDTFPKKCRVTKVVLQHVSDWKIITIKKVFVEVSVIIMFVVLSLVWFVDWTDRFILEGGHWDFRYFFKICFCAKEFWFFGLGVYYGLRIFRSLAYGFRSYGLRIWFSMWFSDFSIWIPVSLTHGWQRYLKISTPCRIVNS